MNKIEYLDASGNVLRTVRAPADEAEVGIHDGEISYRIVDIEAASSSAIVDINAAKAAAKSRIDGAATRARSRYLTAGVEWLYPEKLAQAKDYLAALDSSTPPTSAEAWPYISQEAIAKGISAKDCALSIVFAGDNWSNVIGPKIEALRCSAKVNVDAKCSMDDVYGYLKKVVSELDQA